MPIKSRRRKYIPKKERRTPPEGFACFWKLVKDISRTKGPIRFVIEAEDKDPIHVNVTNGVMLLNGVETYDAAVLSFISRMSEDFERLFMAAAKKYDTDNSLMGDIYIAKIADTSKIQKKPAEMRFNDGTTTRILKITGIGETPSYELDGKKIGEDEGRNFIRKHYNQFITGYKGAIKGMTQDQDEPNKKKRRSPESLKSTRTEEGNIIVDIHGFLGGNEKRGSERAIESGLGEQLLKKKLRGYVD